MATPLVPNPFQLSQLEEIRLLDSPLAAVLFQVRFPAPVTSIQRALESGELREVLSTEFPYAQPQPIFNIVIQQGKTATPEATPASAWTLTDATQAWSLTISPDSIGLTTTNYKSRSDFLARARRIFEAIQSVANPPPIARLGVRYANRVAGDKMIDLHIALTDDIRQMQKMALAFPEGSILHAMNVLVYKWLNDGRAIQARWGLLPEGAVLDASIPPIGTPSWVLDVDCYVDTPQPFDVDQLTSSIEDLAERDYNFFRWVFTDEGLKRFRPDREPK